MRGAMLLALAALVSRLLGALYRPIVTRIFAPFDGGNGAIGMGLANVPLSVYQIILSFTAVGLNVGISRLVSERITLGDMKGARRVFRFSLAVMAGLGLTAAVALWGLAPSITALYGEEAAATVPGFRAMAPALFFASMMAAYRGMFQGFQWMAPNAFSQIVEQIVRVVAGVLFAFLLVRVSVPMGAAGFNFGDTVGAVAGLLYLLFLARRGGAGLWARQQEAAAAEPPAHAYPLEDSWTLIRRIFSVAAPIAIAGAVLPLMMWADGILVFRVLGQPGAGADTAKLYYGWLTNAFALIFLPTIFTSAIYTSILPAITEAVTLGNLEQARKRAGQAYRITLLLAAPAQAGLFILAAELYAFLYPDAMGGPVTAALSWAVVPIMLQQTTAGVLQGVGRISLTLRNFIIGAVVKILLTIWWTGLWGILGAAWATAVGFAIAALLNVVGVEQVLGRTLKTRSMIFKPAAAALAMAGMIAAIRYGLGMAPDQPSRLVTLLLVAAGGGVYGFALLLVGGVRRQEVELLPRVGRPLAALLERTRLLR